MEHDILVIDRLQHMLRVVAPDKLTAMQKGASFLREFGTVSSMFMQHGTASDPVDGRFTLQPCRCGSVDPDDIPDGPEDDRFVRVVQ